MSPCPWSRCPAAPLRPEAARLPWGGGIYEITPPAPGHSSEITEVLGEKKKEKEKDKKKKKGKGKGKCSLGHLSSKPKLLHFFCWALSFFAVYIVPPINRDENVLKPPLIYKEQRNATLRKKKKKGERKKKQHQTSTQLKITILFLDGYQVFALTVPGLWFNLSNILKGYSHFAYIALYLFGPAIESSTDLTAGSTKRYFFR